MSDESQVCCALTESKRRHSLLLKLPLYPMKRYGKHALILMAIFLGSGFTFWPWLSLADDAIELPAHLVEEQRSRRGLEVWPEIIIQTSQNMVHEMHISE